MTPHITGTNNRTTRSTPKCCILL